MVWLISECHPLIGKYELDCGARVEILFILPRNPFPPRFLFFKRRLYEPLSPFLCLPSNGHSPPSMDPFLFSLLPFSKRYAWTQTASDRAPFMAEFVTLNWRPRATMLPRSQRFPHREISWFFYGLIYWIAAGEEAGSRVTFERRDFSSIYGPPS